MSKEKYGKEELELIDGVLASYKTMAEVFVYMNQNDLILMSEAPGKLKGAMNVYIEVNKESMIYIKFALDKILKDNFDEAFILEKMKKQ